MITVTTITANAGQDVLSEQDYLDIYQEINPKHPATGKPLYSLDKFVAFIGSRFTKATWNNWLLSKQASNRTMRNELRAAVDMPALPLSIEEALSDISQDAEILEGLAIVDACLRIITVCKPVWWVLENPVGRLSDYLGKPVMYFQPNDYGDPYTKKTGLWGDFTPPVGLFIETSDWAVEATEGSKMHLLPPSPERQALRSETPAGFARAFFMANR